MWKLTITQKRKSEYSENMITENVEFISNDINELTMLVVRLTGHENAIETSYKIESVGKVGATNNG
jgi:hypothetical protein